ILVINSYLIIDLNNSLRSTAHDSPYNYVIFKDDSTYKAKNQMNGKIEFESNDASFVVNQAVANGNIVHIEKGEYILASDISILNKNRLQISSDGAKILGNGKNILIFGNNYTSSQYNHLFGFEIINSTLRIENSFATTISNMIFKNCNTALEVVNTNTWSEATKIFDSHFINCTNSIVFKTPIGNATGSYASSEIKRCFFNIPDNSIAIIIENLAELSDSQIQTTRFWMGEYGKSNQTGLLVDGSMFQTLLWGVVFESFATDPSNLFGINIRETADPAPILSEGISFLGNWTAKINNPFNIWISGTGGVFKEENILIDIGQNNNFGVPESVHIRPLRITSFRSKIQVIGDFNNNETIKVKIRLLFIDNTFSPNTVEKTFNNASSIWLTDEDMLRLLSSQNIIWAIEVEAKSDSPNTDAIVLFSLYGTTT
ncbi:MAG: hypothetical protein NWF10_02935, partial [Candidatus Bathyarchaeota archaeon]|nr:hypothetical protein [Candidatus Bathyarchaeota archaeon]